LLSPPDYVSFGPNWVNKFFVFSRFHIYANPNLRLGQVSIPSKNFTPLFLKKKIVWDKIFSHHNEETLFNTKRFWGHILSLFS